MPLVCHGQTITLPDSLFYHYNNNVTDNTDELSPMPSSQLSPYNALFEVAPAVTIEDYLTSPDPSLSLFHYFPELPSEFYLHVLVLHLSKVKIPGLEADLARYALMLENFNRNLYKGGGYTVPYVPAVVSDVTSVAQSFASGGGSGVVVSGCLDPLEAYRRWVQERRLLRARTIIRSLEEHVMPTKEEQEEQNLVVSPALWQFNDDSYDVKVKKDGDNPPYRP